MKAGGLYIHVPYCRNKCLYCDFYTGGSRIAKWPSFVSSILEELWHRHNEIDINYKTLYIGGGTPSLLPIGEFEKLIEGIHHVIGNIEWEEFTIEVNPEDVSAEKIEIWRKSGVSRISIGVQTLNDAELINIGRGHDSQMAIEATRLLIEKFRNISVDVMFGLPGQTLESYEKSLKSIIELQPTHISSYSLMLESGTAMTLLAREKRITLPSEEDWIAMYETTLFLLREAGYERYEISNFARPGFESMHNKSYWEGKPYLGLGPAAHSYDGNRIRRNNPMNIKGYLQFYGKNIATSKGQLFYKEEILTEQELREEMLMTRLRTIPGLNLKGFSERFGDTQKEILLQKAKRFILPGLMKENNGNLSITEKGFLVSDSIISSLI